jgi:hypothetical protein
VSVLDELCEYLIDNWGGEKNNRFHRFLRARINSFAAAHPGLVDRTIHCEGCGAPGTEFPPEGWVSEWDSGEGELFMCPACVKEDQT